MNEDGPRIFIVSDSIGETAEKVVRAVAIQFNSDITEIRKQSNVTDKSDNKDYTRSKELQQHSGVHHRATGAENDPGGECDKYGYPGWTYWGPYGGAEQGLHNYSPGGAPYTSWMSSFKRVNNLVRS